MGWGMRFAPCPPAFGLLLDLRKTHAPTHLRALLARAQMQAGKAG